MSTKWYIITLLALGLLTRFMFFGHPNETVFDEVHFGKFISGYYTGEYFFDIHPPLGKLAIAGFAKLSNFEPGFAFAEIGNKYPDKQYMILRFLPSLAGALLPLVIFLLAMEMGFAPLYAFAAGVLIVLENGILTQSHYILMDSFLLLFGFASLLFYFRYTKYNIQNTKYLFLFGLFSGLAISVKWTGLGFLALPLIFEFITIIWNKKFKSLITVLLPPLATAILIYFIFFTAHLVVLNKSGPGDAFMSQGFQKTLTGNKHESDGNVKPSNILQKFNELNVEMYKANQRLTAEHPYSSAWYTWPFMTRTIYYWVDSNSRIYLIGNPVIWWLATVAILFLIANYMANFKNSFKFLPTFLISGYVLNLLPFIGVKRVMFLYHYFTALIFSILILIYFLNTRKSSKWIIGTLIAISTISFFYFAPLNYGLELSPKAYEARVWLDSWK